MDDCSSDLEDELPVFDFLQPGRHLSQSSTSCTKTADGATDSCGDTADVVMMLSDSDDEPDVPLAQRLQQRRLICASTAVNHGEETVTSHLPKQKVSPESEPLLSVDQWSSDAAFHQPSLPVRPLDRGSSAEDDLVSQVKAQKKHRRERWPRDKTVFGQETERKKAEKKAAAKACVSLRPDECMNHMVVVVDPALLQQEGGGTLLASVQALGCSCAIEKQPFPRSVTWMRRAPQADDGPCAAEDEVVMQMTVDDLITLIHGFVQEERLGKPDCGPTLTSWVQAQQRRQPGKLLSLVVIDLEKYFRSQKSQSQKRFREAVTSEDQRNGRRVGTKKRKNAGAGELPEVSRVDVEEALVHLQLHTGVGIRLLPTWNEFADHISMVTKAVAEAPFKRERENTHFSFYLESEWAGGQRVDKAGKGLLQVWRRQIQQLNRVSPDMASVILAAYPSPRLLKKAYRLCKNENQQTSLLSDLVVRRGEGVTATTRRIGPELSKRLFLLMTSCDPEQALDSAL